VHAVDKVDVSVADRTVHRCRPSSQPGTGVARPVVQAGIRLGLDDPPDDLLPVELADDQHAQQVAGDGLGWPGEEAPAQRCQRCYNITARMSSGNTGPSRKPITLTPVSPIQPAMVDPTRARFMSAGQPTSTPGAGLATA
jgi:hypothetical protein